MHVLIQVLAFSILSCGQLDGRQPLWQHATLSSGVHTAHDTGRHRRIVQTDVTYDVVWPWIMSRTRQQFTL